MAAISKTEYLKRYLSSSTEEETKKKRKKKPKLPQKYSRSIIVDDDISWDDLKPKTEESKAKEDEFENAGDDAPIVYDEDGVQAISLDVFKKREDDLKTKWAPLKTDDGSQNQKDVRSCSPTRHRNRRHDSPDISPSRVSRADTPDNSPPRKRNHGSSDLSPSRDKGRSFKKRTNELSSRGGDSRHFSRDSSPPRRVHNDSPKNPKRSRQDSLDLTPPRPKRNDDSDTSPVRRYRHDSHNQSPPRRRRHDSSDLSPPRGTKGSDSDQSPPRRRRQDSSDLSPTRRSGGQESTNQGADRKAGLLSTADLKKENALTRKREEEMFARMDSHKSGRDAKTVHRDKTGRRRDLKAEEEKKREEERKKAIHDEKFKEWGRGVAQTQEAKKKIDDYLHEVNKPLARYKDDEDLDVMLKEKERDDDPMLAYMHKKKATVKKKAGVKEKPSYKGPAPPPNRFGIPPGYRWDGVDRSSGFENKRFAMIANKKATNMIAHKWSIEEM